MDGGHEIWALLVDVIGKRRTWTISREHRLLYAQADVHHDVADKHRPVGQALGGEVAHGLLGRCEQKIRGVVGEDPVVLLGHAPVEGSEPRLEMGDGQVQLDRRERPGDGRVGVAVDDHPVRVLALQDRVERGQDPPGLYAMGAGPDAQVYRGVGDAEAGEKHVGEVRVVMLTRVHDHMLVVGVREGGGHRSQFDELGTGTDNAQDLHKLSRGSADRASPPTGGDRHILPVTVVDEPGLPMAPPVRIGLSAKVVADR